MITTTKQGRTYSVDTWHGAPCVGCMAQATGALRTAEYREGRATAWHQGGHGAEVRQYRFKVGDKVAYQSPWYNLPWTGCTVVRTGHLGVTVVQDSTGSAGINVNPNRLSWEG